MPEPIKLPLVFVNENRKKPAHVVHVRRVMRPVNCKTGCGLYYVAASKEEMSAGDVCPDCNVPPTEWHIGEPEEIDLAVHTAFGNGVDVDFLRSVGPVTKRFIGLVPSSSPVASGLIHLAPYAPQKGK